MIPVKLWCLASGEGRVHITEGPGQSESWPQGVPGPRRG